jgi:hypothetical protein
MRSVIPTCPSLPKSSTEHLSRLALMFRPEFRTHNRIPRMRSIDIHGTAFRIVADSCFVRRSLRSSKPTSCVPWNFRSATISTVSGPSPTRQKSFCLCPLSVTQLDMFVADGLDLMHRSLSQTNAILCLQQSQRARERHLAAPTASRQFVGISPIIHPSEHDPAAVR